MVAIVPGDSADDANITEMLRGCDDEQLYTLLKISVNTRTNCFKIIRKNYGTVP